MGTTWQRKLVGTTNFCPLCVDLVIMFLVVFIEFWLINSKTSAGYILWWNGETLREMYVQNRAHRPNDNTMLMGPALWQWWDEVERFWKKRVKLSWLWYGSCRTCILEIFTQRYFNSQHYVALGVGWKFEDWIVWLGVGVTHNWACGLFMACGNRKNQGNFEKEKWWVAPKSFRVHNRIPQDPPGCFTKEVKSFMVNKIASQLCDQHRGGGCTI